MDIVYKLFDTFGVDWPRFIGQLAIWLVLFIVLKKYAFGPIQKVLEERRQRIEESIANAERIRQELEKAEKSSAELIAKANEKANFLIDEAKKSADSVGARKILEATQQAEALIRKAEEAAALERDRLMAELKQELGRLVVSTTSKVTGKVLTSEDQSRLQKETLQEVGTR